MFGVWLNTYAWWLMLSPLFLLGQVFPISETETSVEGA